MSTRPETGTRFRQTRWTIGYSPDEVDTFVSAVEASLQSPTPHVSASDVACSRFTLVQLKPGYDINEVDHYLDEAQQQLSLREPDLPLQVPHQRDDEPE